MKKRKTYNMTAALTYITGIHIADRPRAPMRSRNCMAVLPFYICWMLWRYLFSRWS
ncbi:MAG: hypothetical protein LBE76_00120 [Nitrososphaerota archaeon]|nr:hypothetical protein [Nitrososphaerota archaeon]